MSPPDFGDFESAGLGLLWWGPDYAIDVMIGWIELLDPITITPGSYEQQELAGLLEQAFRVYHPDFQVYFDVLNHCIIKNNTLSTFNLLWATGDHAGNSNLAGQLLGFNPDANSTGAHYYRSSWPTQYVEPPPEEFVGPPEPPAAEETGPEPESIQVTNDPNILAIITPYVIGGFETIIVDKPPVPPEISFYPFKGINNKVNILLNSNTGRMSTKPIAILDGDAAEFEQQYLTRNGESKSFDDIDTVEFVSEDPVDAYQLFRLPEEPTSYGSFNNNLLSVINPDWGIPGSLIDTIVPNRKYYYCARSLDVHNNVSNPTFIFEIQIIDNNGQVFLRQNIFTFEPVKNTFVKPGRRFIYVEPSLQQTVLEQSVAVARAVDYPVPNNSILGSFGIKKVWGKNFKLRLTSKKTGRKMDLNINFKNSGIVNQTE
jgi:hypothetical protein